MLSGLWPGTAGGRRGPAGASVLTTWLGNAMGSLIVRDKEVAKKKGYWALGAWAGSAVLFTVAGAPILGMAAAGGASYLTYKWFVFRAKRGMRF